MTVLTSLINAQTYFDHNRPRVDAVTWVNIVALFYVYHRGEQARRTLDWIRLLLQKRAFSEGTRYYPAEGFLFFLGRLLRLSKSPDLLGLRDLVKECVVERIGLPSDALALSMRIITCQFLGMQDEVDLRVLRSMQCADGGWEACLLYRYGSTDVEIGNRGYTTALAVQAIEGASRQC